MSNKNLPSGTCAPTRAALYIRVSSEEQAMHGLSLLAQRETLVEYAKTHHFQVADIYADEGITARKKYRNRTQFMRMLSDVKLGKVDVILFIKLDRWFRNIADYYEVQRILDDYHVAWIATEERYDTATANGRLNLNIRLSIAQDESDRTSERIKFVFQNKVSRGEVISGKVPLGYCIVQRHLEPDPTTAPIVQDLFQQYLNIRSVSALRKYLMDTYGLVYAHTSLRMLLQNERYIGKAHGQNGFCPAIIDEQTFFTVQHVIEVRAQRNASDNRRVYLFTSLVYCAECGNRLSAHIVANKYVYYRCTRYEKLHLCPHKKRTSELVLERWLLNNLMVCFTAYNTELLTSQHEQNIQKVDESRIRAKMEKLKDLYLNDLIDRNLYERDYNALREDLKAGRALQDIRTPVDLSHLDEVLSIYSSLSRESKKAFWSRTIDRITIDNQDHFIIHPTSSPIS